MDDEYKQIATLRQFVHPEHGVIDHFITELTGIKNNQVKNAPKLQEALTYMLDWLGDRQYKIFEWSDSDHAQLMREIISKNLDTERVQDFMCEDRWIDYQEIFGENCLRD